jgi:hypothetical protein
MKINIIVASTFLGYTNAKLTKGQHIINELIYAALDDDASKDISRCISNDEELFEDFNFAMNHLRSNTEKGTRAFMKETG